MIFGLGFGDGKNHFFEITYLGVLSFAVSRENVFFIKMPFLENKARDGSEMSLHKSFKKVF